MPNLRFLIVDDDPTTRTLLARWITQARLGETHELENGSEALEFLSKTQVDLVVLGVKMPIVSGIEMLTLLRGDPKLKDLPVVIISAQGTSDGIREAMRLRIDDYILKPLDRTKSMDRIVAAVNRIQEKRRTQAQAAGTTKPKVLVADPDDSFREFARKALDPICRCEVAGNVGQLMVSAIRLQPSVILLSKDLPGLRLDFMLHKLAQPGAQIYLLAAAEEEVKHEHLAGVVTRHFMPTDFRAAVSRTLDAAKPAETAGADEAGEAAKPAEIAVGSLLSGIEPELMSTIQDVLEKATGNDAKEIEPPSEQPAFDASGRVRLDCQEPPLAVYASVQSGDSVLRDFARSMLGVDEGSLNDEAVQSSLRELLNVIGGKIKSCCAAAQVDLKLGSPETGDALPEVTGQPEYQLKKLFGWDSGQVFEVSITAVAESGS